MRDWINVLSFLLLIFPAICIAFVIVTWRLAVKMADIFWEI